MLLQVLLGAGGPAMTPADRDRADEPDAARGGGPAGTGRPRRRRGRRGRAADRPAAHGGRRGGAELVVFPELALTTFFPAGGSTTRPSSTRSSRREMPGADTKPLFDEARALGRRLLASATPSCTPDGHPSLQHRGPRRAATVGSSRRYRKVHLPGHERARAVADRSSTSSAATSSRARGLRLVSGVRRRGRPRPVQRPALARDLPGARPAGRRADPHRLQHAHPLPARPRARTAWPGSTTTW